MSTQKSQRKRDLSESEYTESDEDVREYEIGDRRTKKDKEAPKTKASTSKRVKMVISPKRLMKKGWTNRDGWIEANIIRSYLEMPFCIKFGMFWLIFLVILMEQIQVVGEFHFQMCFANL
ncbi:uncharacterized protein LOC124928206 [Impatiens glandulifera]|uniref:uncharacterized protein LOC124928206 n=1 Tax=Impatiens glandulifera TaxID=253017 RepID=UPI001FB11703|nr:uncharacterized protein LOC124928206 [Impatiens glandulifera]